MGKVVKCKVRLLSDVCKQIEYWRPVWFINRSSKHFFSSIIYYPVLFVKIVLFRLEVELKTFCGLLGKKAKQMHFGINNG